MFWSVTLLLHIEMSYLAEREVIIAWMLKLHSLGSTASSATH